MASRVTSAFRAGAAVARAVPAPVGRGLAQLAGTGVAVVPGDRRAQVERNLRRVYGPDFGGAALRRAVGATFRAYARYWAESFRLPGTTPEELDAGMTCDRWDRVDEGLAKGSGVILALPHLGLWEWAGFWAATVKKVPITVVVEPLEPPELFAWFADLRRSFGMHVVPLGPEAGAAVIGALRNNHVVCLLCDRDLGGGGVEVDFFGERTRLPAGPATLALRTGATLVPVAVYDRRGHHVAMVRPPIPTERQGRLRDDVGCITQVLAGELELLIRAAPTQWHLLQPNWPSDPGYQQGAGT